MEDLHSYTQVRLYIMSKNLTFIAYTFHQEFKPSFLLIHKQDLGLTHCHTSHITDIIKPVRGNCQQYGTLLVLHPPDIKVLAQSPCLYFKI